ncbi:hypothetical protein Scep_024261 [Stephania cephalantha]|uniref:Uncharacterized protein n=1 Tax=Stephania cephalantha TaxID=152367 RepID=A0AAP0HY38_9MAGN
MVSIALLLFRPNPDFVWLLPVVEPACLLRHQSIASSVRYMTAVSTLACSSSSCAKPFAYGQAQGKLEDCDGGSIPGMGCKEPTKEYRSLSGPDPFVDRLLKHLLLLHVAPHSFNHLLVIAACSPEKGETRKFELTRLQIKPGEVLTRPTQQATPERGRAPLTDKGGAHAHLLVWWCAEQVYPMQRFTRYAVLGDDVVIADNKVAEDYQDSDRKMRHSMPNDGEFASAPTAAI